MYHMEPLYYLWSHWPIGSFEDDNITNFAHIHTYISALLHHEWICSCQLPFYCMLYHQTPTRLQPQNGWYDWMHEHKTSDTWGLVSAHKMQRIFRRLTRKKPDPNMSCPSSFWVRIASMHALFWRKRKLTHHQSFSSGKPMHDNFMMSQINPHLMPHIPWHTSSILFNIVNIKRAVLKLHNVQSISQMDIIY